MQLHLLRLAVNGSVWHYDTVASVMYSYSLRQQYTHLGLGVLGKKEVAKKYILVNDWTCCPTFLVNDKTVGKTACLTKGRLRKSQSDCFKPSSSLIITQQGQQILENILRESTLTAGNPSTPHQIDHVWQELKLEPANRLIPEKKFVHLYTEEWGTDAR